MIGLDDFLDGYLATEIDDHFSLSNENENNSNFDNNILQFKTKQINLESKDIAAISQHIPRNSVLLSSQLDYRSEEFESTISKSELFHDVLENENDDHSHLNSFYIEPELSSDTTLICEINNETEVDVDEPERLEFFEICKICKTSNPERENPDFWLICYGCGEAFHRKCLNERVKRVKCEQPIIFRNRIVDPEDEKYTHGPWFCNSCVKCSCCSKSNHYTISTPSETLKQEIISFKDSFVACRHCGKVSCLSCYNSESFSINSSRFENLKNYSCPGCLQCVNCGLNAGTPKDPFSTKSRRRSSICAQMFLPPKVPPIILYKDLTLCRPCYLSDQICATCPRCKQIYHSLHSHYDFGETPFNSDFSLCPMVMCDDCGSWTHCQCEGISEKEYERLGTDKTSEFSCIDCRNKRNKKRSKLEIPPSNTPNREGNVIFVGGHKIFFMYWSYDEAWKRKLYEFSYEADSEFTLKSDNLCIKSDSLDKLIHKFKELFVHNHSKTCCKAINPQLFFNPMSLLALLEGNRVNSHELHSYLREKVSKMDGLVCAKTRPYLIVKGAHVKSSVPKNRNLLSTMANFTSVPPGSSSPNNSNNSGKLTVKYLFMQYAQSVRSNSTSFTIDSTSQGLALRLSSIAGFGLFATKQFLKNSLIIEYCGEMLNGDRLVDKRDAYYNSLGKRYRQSCYLFRLDEFKVLDATHKGNLSRFINHSCDPNCYSRVVQIDGAKKLLIFASKIIEPGEEILYDYKFPDEDQKIPCLCGSEKCRTWMN